MFKIENNINEALENTEAVKNNAIANDESKKKTHKGGNSQEYFSASRLKNYETRKNNIEAIIEAIRNACPYDELLARFDSGELPEAKGEQKGVKKGTKYDPLQDIWKDNLSFNYRALEKYNRLIDKEKTKSIKPISEEEKVKQLTKSELQAENEDLKKQIEELQAKIASKTSETSETSADETVK